VRTNLLIIFFLAWLCADTCTNNKYLKEINVYLNASTKEEKSKYMAEDFHSHFMTNDGSGKNKSESLTSFQSWDGPLHPDIQIINYSFHDSIWKITFNEQNDFTKPIGFPGWKGATTFTFNSAGLIKETLYVPDSANLSYRPYLKPALDWLQKNMPGELSEVYQNNKLIQTEATAIKWSALLKKWKSQKTNSFENN
jgi:hypothetical protein